MLEPEDSPFLVVGTAWAKTQRQTYKDNKNQEFVLTHNTGVPVGSSS